MAEDERKTELTAELTAARHRISGELGRLRQALDFPARAKVAVVRNPLAWVSGATLFGVLLAKLPARRKKVLVQGPAGATKAVRAGRTGLVLGALKIAFDLARPAVVKWATQRVSSYLDPAKNGGRPPY